jgi:transcriptional regulator with XRE-family HTH domain
MTASRVKERSATAKASAMSKFSRQLRGWREKKGWSQIELAQQLGFSNSLISHLEHQEKQPSADFAEKCDQVFDLPGTFADLQELVAREAWPSYFAPVIDFQTRAIRMHDWDPRVLPGFLQTEDYARAVIQAGRPYLPADEVESRVTTRMELQRILQREVGRPQLWEVVHEGVLRHVIGSPEIMQAQLDRVIEAADSPDMVVQVLPFAAHDHPGTGGPISLFEFADAPSVGYTECNGGGMIVEQLDQVAGLVTSMNLIRAAALPPRDSLNLLRTIRDEIE